MLHWDSSLQLYKNQIKTLTRLYKFNTKGAHLLLVQGVATLNILYLCLLPKVWSSQDTSDHPLGRKRRGAKSKDGQSTSIPGLAWRD
jgi:hypothetical protein